MKRIFNCNFPCAMSLLAAGVMVATGALAQQGSPSTGSSSGSGASTPTGSTTQGAHSTAHSTTPAATPAKSATALTTDKQKDSYAFGLNVGRQLSQQPVDLDTPTFLAGLKDALEKNKPQMTDDEVKAALSQLASQANAKEEAQNQAVGEANLKQGQEFLADNKTKEGVVELPSGLQYKIITTGTGPKPTAADTVVCDYRGTLIDGKEFDSSYKRGQPATFPVSRVIKGWTEALQMMPVGSKWQLFIPANLAYGPSGAGSDIGPNSTLVFEVELHSIQGK